MTTPSEKDSKTIEDEKNDLSLPSATTDEIPNFGWSSYAERINGRFAMIGFFGLLLIELLSNNSFLLLKFSVFRSSTRGFDP